MLAVVVVSLVMGILNRTPDSFYDQGAYWDFDDFVRKAEQLVTEGADFLDVGGGANADQIKNAFRILLADTDVKAVLINIFGGILRCDILAEGVIAAVKELHVEVPVVVRLEGTNVERGREILEEADFDFIVAATMADAAEKVVAASGGAS